MHESGVYFIKGPPNLRRPVRKALCSYPEIRNPVSLRHDQVAYFPPTPLSGAERWPS